MPSSEAPAAGGLCGGGPRPDESAPRFEEVDWRAISPRGRAILRWIAVPVATGLTHQQIAHLINVYRPEIPDLPLPGVVNANVVGGWMRELRAEIRQQFEEE